MKKQFSIFFLFISFHIVIAKQGIKILPLPNIVEKHDGLFHLTGDFSVSVPEKPSERICFKANDFLRRLDGRISLSILQGIISVSHPQRPAFPSLNIEYEKAATTITEDDESYILEVFPDKISIHATTDLGASYALETLLQTLQYDRTGFSFPCFKIIDNPKFSYRAIMLDPARRFLTIDDLRRTIHAMSVAKLNVLHLRLNDDHGWRIESKAFPKLHNSASDGNYYTQKQIKDLVQYADNNGVTIVPEFHLYSHATAIATAYPEFALQQGPFDLERKIGVCEPVLNFMNEKVYDFSDKIISEWSTLFTSKYIHLGGLPQKKKKVYDNEDVKEFMKKNGLVDEVSIKEYYYTKATKIFKKYPKKLVVYDDVSNLKVFSEATIEVRHGRMELYKMASFKRKCIYSGAYQLDHLLPTKTYYAQSPLPTSLEMDESEINYHIKPEDEKYVLGGEGQLWGELVSSQTLDNRLWSRALGLAERFWSSSIVTNQVDFFKRADALLIQLQEIEIIPYQKMEGMLSQFAQIPDVQPLVTLAKAVEPYPYFERDLGSDKYKTYTPLTFFADAVMPDPIDARKFYYHVESYSHTMSALDKAELDKILKKWRDNHATFLILAYENPSLEKLINLSQNLSKLAEIGLDALERVESKIPAPKSWYDANFNIINGLKDDYYSKSTDPNQLEDGRCRIAILEAMTIVLDMANSDLAIKKMEKTKKSNAPTKVLLRY